MAKKELDKLNPSVDDFAALLEESMSKINLSEGNVIKGRVTAIENDFVIVDVGLKTEGRIPVREFKSAAGPSVPEQGDNVDVYLDRVENSNGEAVLSREKARRQESWNKLEKLHAEGVRVEGVIFGRVKGGFTVDLDGAIAFLPGSQVDIKPIRDIGGMLNVSQPFQILKMDRKRGNIVVSRRAIIEGSKGDYNPALADSLEEGQTIDGIVKNITDYGAFIDLGGMDGLLHVTDISWKRVNHPSDLLKIGQSVKVQVTKINAESKRVSLGMKQLEADPWDGISEKYPINTKLKGNVTNITDYGAFVEIEPGIEGLTHVSEMSWTKKNIHPGKIVSSSQEVEVVILEIDHEKRRISLGMKQCVENPWTNFAENYPVGTVVGGEVKNATEFGLFVGLEGDLDGMIHLSDLDWNEKPEVSLERYTKGEPIEVKVLDIDIEKERISLGVKQLSDDPFSGLSQMKKGDTVTCYITNIRDGGLDVTIGKDGVSSSIKRADLSVDKSEQRPDRFAVGEMVDAKVTQIDAKNSKLSLSIKSLQIDQEKEAVKQYGSADSGASLGDILGEALNIANDQEEIEISEESEDAIKKTEKKAKPKAEKKEVVEKKEKTKDSKVAK
ncbi:MAG: 30S ribosomal protein S1 [Hyphomicrobiales bacterium]|nr:MAG: 30S ribosomal protein S1 [Hyphomicrobiales bacterium]|tara:strand:+ start:7979 stop:9814 length:1836 start_codon:yes stop_codon:yes gene_type:complete